MASGKTLLLAALSLLPLAAGCSGSGGGSQNALVSVTQDLTADATGRTTVLDFQAPLPATLGPGNFEADGGQIALNVTIAGDLATVTWDDRVTPTHQVRPVGFASPSVWTAVATSDASAPTFTITDATQTPGLGGDTIVVEFSGPSVVEALAEDLASWDLVVGGTSLDLTGSLLVLDVPSQVLTITLGAQANLHASFELAAVGVASVADVAADPTPVAGAATGDTTAPSLVTVEQNLAADEYGFVVDFVFDEAMDPVFSAQLGNFDAGFPVLASQVEQPAIDTLRVTFTEPMIPGVDSVTLANLVDAHGNALPDPGGPVAVASSTTVANGYASSPVLDTVENSGGDTLTVVLDQAIDPASAEDPARWAVESPIGSALDLAGATIDYDLMAKTVSFVLAEDLTTGDSFRVGPGATAPLDVDGEDFAATFDGTVTGDVAAPTVTLVVQDRELDPWGLTLDVVLSEDVDAAAANDPASWAVTGGASVLSATLQPSLDRVRVVLDALAVPGEHTLSAQAVADLAGNVMPAPQTGVAIGSTDTTAPTATGPVAYAFEGADDDSVRVTFDDFMVTADVEDPTSWLVESPLGTPLDTTNASVTYAPLTGHATLVFDGGDEVDLLVRDDVQVSLPGVRDVGGNALATGALTGVVDGEARYPVLESVWVEAANPSRLHVRFDEPMRWLDDLAGLAAYEVRDDGGLLVGTPASVTVDADRSGATLLLGFGVTPGTHTLDVRGVADLAGNDLFPVSAAAIAAEDAGEPGLDPGVSTLTAVSGEDNDAIVVRFDRALSAVGAEDAANYDVDDGSGALDLSSSSFSFDGDRTVTVDLDQPGADALDTGTSYTVTIDGLTSRQGVPMAAADAEVVVAGGDATPPALVASRSRLDAASPTDTVLVEFDEAVASTAAEDVASYLKGGVAPDTAVRVGPRTVRVTWSGGASAGETLDVTMEDVAGNAGATSQLVQAAVTAGPVVLEVTGEVTPGFGGDRVLVRYDVPVDPATALAPSAYAADQGGSAVDLSGAQVRYESATNTVALLLPEGVELDPTQFLHVTVTGVENHDGVVMSPPADLNGNVTGDADPPAFAAAFVNYRADASGRVVDVRFTEDVDPTFAETPVNWTVSGGQTVSAAELLTGDVLRLTLSAALASGDAIDTVALPDAAGIASGAISIEPEL